MNPKAQQRQGQPTIRLKVRQLLEAGKLDDYASSREFDRDVARQLSCSQRTVAAYRNEYIDRQIARGLFVPLDIVEEIVELREAGGRFPAICDEINAKYGTTIGPRVAQRIADGYNRGLSARVKIEQDWIPFDTLCGRVLVHVGTGKAMGCESCGEEMRELCERLVKMGDCLPCEGILELEVI